jgi:hypothetical protein
MEALRTQRIFGRLNCLGSRPMDLVLSLCQLPSTRSVLKISTNSCFSPRIAVEITVMSMLNCNDLV